MKKIQTVKFARKPFFVDAVQVTEANMNDVAEWCKGTVITKNDKNEDVTPYIKVRVLRPVNEKQTKAYVGEWVLYAGQGFKVYTNTAMLKDFEVAEDDSDYGKHLVEIDEARLLPPIVYENRLALDYSHNVD